MTILDRFKVLRGKLWFRRKRIPLLLIPAAWVALWLAVPFSIWNSPPFMLFCVVCTACGFIIRSRAVLANWRAEDCRSLAEQVLLCGSRQEVQDILARTNGQQNARQV